MLFGGGKEGDGRHRYMSITRRETSHNTWLKGVLGVALVLWVGGWGILCAQTDTEHEAEATLDRLQIDVADDPNVSPPELPGRPPKIFKQIVGGDSEWKLSYFCKQHTAGELKRIVSEQFGASIFDQKGRETRMVDYAVTSYPLGNQLIIRCPTEEDALAVLEFLEVVDVAPVQVKIDCLISEVYANMTFDRETTMAIDNLFGESVAMKPGGTAFGADVRQLVLEDEFLPAFPGASMREVARARMGLNIGFLNQAKDGHAFAALIDLLESRGYLKILMNPTLEVVNGHMAKVSSSQHVPLDRTTMRRTNSDFLLTKTEYADVVDSLEIVPHVFAGGYIGLETTIVLGSKNTPEGVKQVPIITKKQIANKSNRIRQGESLIIGGLRKNEEYAVVRGIPILKDIPLLGFLFSSEDTEQRAVETIFILTPTISTGGRPTAQVMKEVQKTHESSRR